jgi:AcrR family transcriptional regulator
MPRITPAHEQAVRQRIIDAAVQVLGELGYQRATVQDVVRASGLSVGAVYTYFKNKEELFVAACTCEVDAEKSQLRLRMAELGSVTDRLRAALDFAIAASGLDGELGIRASLSMVARESPQLRQVLRDRRTEMVAFARLVLAESLAREELPRWIDADGVASAFVTLIDGFSVRAMETGFTAPEEARREAYALLELLVGAPPQLPATVERLRENASAAHPEPRSNQ